MQSSHAWLVPLLQTFHDLTCEFEPEIMLKIHILLNKGPSESCVWPQLREGLKALTPTSSSRFNNPPPFHKLLLALN